MEDLADKADLWWLFRIAVGECQSQGEDPALRQVENLACNPCHDELTHVVAVHLQLCMHWQVRHMNCNTAATTLTPPHTKWERLCSKEIHDNPPRTSQGVSSGPKMLAFQINRFSSEQGLALQPCERHTHMHRNKVCQVQGSAFKHAIKSAV